MSGSPAYTFRDVWKLAGFLVEGSTSDGRLYFVHASFLSKHGTIAALDAQDAAGNKVKRLRAKRQKINN